MWECGTRARKPASLLDFMNSACPNIAHIRFKMSQEKCCAAQLIDMVHLAIPCCIRVSGFLVILKRLFNVGQ